MSGDISVRKNSDEARRETMARPAFELAPAQLQAVMDGSSSCIYVTDREGRVVTANRQMGALLGLAHGEIIGRSFLEVSPGDSIEQLWKQDRHVMERGTASRWEVTITSRDGDRTFLKDLFPLRAPDGSIESWAAIMVDISERKLTEDLLYAAREAADEANRAKSEFLSRMSHELRTPLNVVLGFAQLLELEALTPKQHGDVRHILNASSHLLDVIDDILKLSRLDADKLSLSLEPVRVVPVLNDAVGLVGPLAASNGIRIEVVEGSNAIVLADKQRLNQVLLNLLTNAIKYNRENGSVRLETSMREGGLVRISVADTGIGISEAMMDRLFTPFDRLGADATGIEGTGLGLSLSRGLTEAMSGTIGAESTVGLGSTFWVDLPVAVLPVTAVVDVASGRADSATGDYSGKTVLYIDDNLGSIALVERVLEARPGARLVAVSQGRIALDLLREHPADLVLLDLNLPDMSGLEVFQEILADPATRSIPVVVCSADASISQIRRMREAGVREYLTKPLNLGRLLQVMDESLAASV